MHKLLLAIPFVIGLALAACGGKDDDEQVFFEDAPANPDKAMLAKLINDLRAAGQTCGSTGFSAAPAMTWNDTLATVAKLHSQDMAANDKLSHTGTDGSLVDERITRSGYVWSSFAENLLKGTATEEAAIAAWLESASHCENLMDPTLTEFGVGTSGPYWTLVMASH